jgi:photosystem II stability/assembly factor-like uncharacterized protein
MEVIMFRLKLFLFFNFFSTLLYSQSGWFQQNSGTNKYLNSCYFVNDYIGFIACNDGLIIKTTNGGTSWYTVYNNNRYDMYTVFFIDNSTGWVGGLHDSINTDTNIVFKTTNGGQTWTETFVDTLGISFFSGIQFINPLTGYLASYNLKKTTNGGINWFIALDSISLGVFFINNFTGWTGGFSTGIKKTTDAGFTWVQQVMHLPNQYNTDIYFSNEQNGFLILGFNGWYGNLYTTTNSGINWNQYNLPYYVTSISFPNENTGYMLAQIFPIQYVSKTTDGGINWILHNISPTKYFHELFFSSVNTGWVVGDSGVIFKTTNGGVTIGINPISSEIPVNFSLLQNYPNPFNPTTCIKFAIPPVGNGRDRSVTIKIYDVLGNEISTLVNQKLNPGSYEVTWPAPAEDASIYPSGTYFYRLQAGDFTETKKMILLK